MAFCPDNGFRYAAFFNTALRAVGRNKLRSFLSVLGVVFGVMAVMTIICVGQGARDEALRRVEQLGTRNIYLKQPQREPQQRIEAGGRNLEGLRIGDVARLENGGGNIRQVAGLKELIIPVIGALRQITPQIAACSANYADLLNLRVTAGRFIRQQDIDRHQMVCVLGSDVEKKLSKDGRLYERLRIGSQTFTVVGHLDRIDLRDSSSASVSVRNHNEMILLPMGAQRWLPEAAGAGARQDDGQLSEIIIEISDSSRVPASAQIVRRILDRGRSGIADYQMVVPLELLEQSRRTQELFNLFLGAIAGISLLVGGIGIMNIMLATISERKKEIGIRRAVGAQKRHIIAQFLAESILLTLLGGVIGVGLGAASAYGIAVLAPWHATLSLAAVLAPLAMSVLIGLFFGLYPAYQAASVDPIQALS